MFVNRSYLLVFLNISFHHLPPQFCTFAPSLPPSLLPSHLPSLPPSLPPTFPLSLPPSLHPLLPPPSLPGTRPGPGQCQGLLPTGAGSAAATGLRGSHRRLSGGSEAGAGQQGSAEAAGSLQEEAEDGEGEGEETICKHVQLPGRGVSEGVLRPACSTT